MPYNCYFNISQSEFILKDGSAKHYHNTEKTCFIRTAMEQLTPFCFKTDPNMTVKHQVKLFKSTCINNGYRYASQVLIHRGK